MARQKLILAKNISEANRFARLIGLQRFTYRSVRNAAAIRGVRNAEVFLLSSFLERRDRFVILAALKQAKTLDVSYVDVADFPEMHLRRAVVDGVAADVDPRGPLTDEILALAFRANAIFSAPDAEPAFIITAVPDETPVPEHHQEMVATVLPEEKDEPTGETVPSEDPAPTPVARRRTRCADCGELHFKGECSLAIAPVAPAAPPVDFF